ncbi:MAG TPA: lipid-A-disaccharide synthase [Steroidobacteraceae bacterium]|nr:lipid-A-disaccharide synthase [Steroidobacteraceae bacterium]
MDGQRIVLVAGETSGDNLGASLIRALRSRRPGLRFEGIAGPQMVAAGCTAWASAERLSVMGLFEVVRHLPELIALRRRTAARALAAAPAAFVGIDAPEFNLSIAARLKRRGVPTVQYVSPQVWAWRQGRVARMARTLDLVLCLLPFEKRFYEGVGLNAEFVGHPLADRLPLEPDRAAARAALALPTAATVVAILPGSRQAEVERLAPDFIGAARWLDARRPGVRFVAPMANESARALFTAALEQCGEGIAVLLTEGAADRALAACDCALVASGTATLEALLCKRPMVVAYRVGAATAALVRLLGLVKTPYFAQPNLLAGRLAVPELFQAQVTPERLGQELLSWLDDPARVARLAAEFRSIHESLRRGASERAAEAILALIEAQPPGSRG